MTLCVDRAFDFATGVLSKLMQNAQHLTLCHLESPTGWTCASFLPIRQPQVGNKHWRCPWISDTKEDISYGKINRIINNWGWASKSLRVDAEMLHKEAFQYAYAKAIWLRILLHKTGKNRNTKAGLKTKQNVILQVLTQVVLWTLLWHQGAQTSSYLLKRMTCRHQNIQVKNSGVGFVLQVTISTCSRR